MIKLKSEQQVLQEGFRVLLDNMEPSKVGRFWSACNFASGDQSSNVVLTFLER